MRVAPPDDELDNVFPMNPSDARGVARKMHRDGTASVARPGHHSNQSRLVDIGARRRLGRV